MNICHCDWFNNEADWPIAGQDKVRQESQTRRILGRRRVESEESPRNTKGTRDSGEQVKP